ncbi:hypothetical protein [Pseudomonas sp. RIT-PI-AD]|uniref:hypothetical protein n=1 Tax=Pseudomonas sp. RIT-PI-AD TaxID=3035294 RepID=UPI0021D9C21E|nr:hypothetical protein [Pseudomonas sp. RIT-PI-AD]
MDQIYMTLTETIDGTFKMVMGDILYLMSFHEKYGSKVTVADLRGAGTMKDAAKVLAAIGSAGYLGAMIGSAAVATGRYGACGSYIIDAFAFARMHNLDRPWLISHLQRHPEIYTPNHPARGMYARFGRGSLA